MTDPTIQAQIDRRVALALRDRENRYVAVAESFGGEEADSEMNSIGENDDTQCTRLR